ncbi:alpha-ketoglutarate-dependent dioxygenase alkB homolog 7, mitochondrial [Cylas formicarius]|uniref:alpha-ketoglutarate-dependent dioxygenase alkB homolog 7, mitochondrial n=1 Tax=Cylas formicarius TaxID=197179 RepID=UPI00295880B2|nr:alpha-ketoglutarate-dependent dioxygenase alkB homolog 7, mitochondrial [Cylas formicarius]
MICILITKRLLPTFNIIKPRRLSSKAEFNNVVECPSYFHLSNSFIDFPNEAKHLIDCMHIQYDFIDEDQEKSLFDEADPFIKRLRYQVDHWDDAIHQYRETEKLKWNPENTKIINKVRELAFPRHVGQIKYVHILDLDKDGYIKPHIDAVRFCGDTIAGLSLLSDSIMRLVNEQNKSLYGDILLKRRSLYVMKGTARFDYTHEILANEKSIFKGETIVKNRRISIICRNEPDPKYMGI